MSATIVIGAWEADPSAGTITIHGAPTKLTPRSMSVLVHLAENAGEVVTGEALLGAFWPRTVTSPNAVYKVITELRDALREDASESARIETVPKRGYRLVTAISPRSVAVANSTEKPKSIAVLRFRNLDANPDHDYLAEGLAAALLESLSQAGDLSVVDRELSFQHAIGNETVQEIGRALGVEHLLEGSVTQRGDQLRVSVALCRCSDGERVYRYQEDEPIEKIPQLRDRVIAKLLVALEIHLDAQRAEDMRNWGTRNIDAYLAAREADSFHMRLDQKSLKYAMERFRAAIALDRGFVRVYELFACTLADLDMFTPDAALRRSLREELARLRVAVKRLDGNSQALAAIDTCERKMTTHSWREVEAVTRAGIQEEGTPCRPNAGYLQYADLLKSGHLFREAALYLDLYEQFEKDQPAVLLGRTELIGLTLGPQRAIAMVKKSLVMFQNNIATLTGFVGQFALIGEYAEAEHYLARLEDNDQYGAWAYTARLYLGALRGDLSPGSEPLRAALADPRATQFTRGITHFILGDVEAGIDAWRRGLQNPAGPMAVAFQFTVNTETFYPASVVDDPRYQDYLDEVGIGRQWTAYLRERVAELAPITGIQPGDPAPQKVVSR